MMRKGSGPGNARLAQSGAGRGADGCGETAGSHQDGPAETGSRAATGSGIAGTVLRAALVAALALPAWPASRMEIPEGRYRNPFRPASADTAKVNAFRLDGRAATVEEFLAFVKAHPEWRKSRARAPLVDSLYLASWGGDLQPPRDKTASPVTEVSWFAAKAYCEAAGGRLPTTDEWERVANVLPPGQDSAARLQGILDWYARPAAARSPAGPGSRDAFGVRDLFGRVWEWTSDFNATRPGPDADAAFCGGGGQATARGADYATYMRYSFRASLKPAYAVSSLGFRCAESAAPSSAAAAPVDLPSGSLYRLASRWEDDAGRRFALSSLRGKPRILTLFFSHCQSTCPMVLGTLKGLDAALPKGWESGAGVVMATLDPGRDGAADLADFRRRMSLSSEGYVLIRGGEEDTRELAMALGAAYRRSDKNGGMEHEAVVAVLDAEGRVIHRHDGSVGASTLVDELKAVQGR